MKSPKFGLLGWIKVSDLAVVICAALLVLFFYLYFSGTFTWFPVIILLLIVILASLVVGVIASYRSLGKSDSDAQFRVDRQLVRTLRALNAPSDVILGLRAMLRPYNANVRIIVKGETNFLKLLQARFGNERAKEISPQLFRYAGKSDVEDSEAWILLDEGIQDIVGSKVFLRVEKALDTQIVPVVT